VEEQVLFSAIARAGDFQLGTPQTSCRVEIALRCAISPADSSQHTGAQVTHTLTLLFLHRWHAGLGLPVLGIGGDARRWLAYLFRSLAATKRSIRRYVSSRDGEGLLVWWWQVELQYRHLGNGDGCAIDRRGDGVVEVRQPHPTALSNIPLLIGSASPSQEKSNAVPSNKGLHL
jgi:hypothetical protein